MKRHSPIRYPGGKNRAISLIEPFIPTVDYLMSPFCGGGSLELYYASQGTSVQAFDTYRPLVSYWEHQIHNPEELFETVEAFCPLEDETFDWFHQNLHLMEPSVEQAAGFFVLNYTTFIGAGQSAGRSIQHDRFHSGSLARILRFDPDNFDVGYMDFRDSIPACPDHYLYLDPPYDLEKGKDNLYGSQGSHHHGFDHDALFDLLKDRPNWLMSYNKNSHLKEMYEGFPIDEITFRYSSSNKMGAELIIQSRI